MNTDEKNKHLLAFLHLLGRFRDEEAGIYNSIAPTYERFAIPWDAEFARPALDYLLTESAKRVPKGGRILDAGCGTGLRIPEIIEHFEPEEVVGLDLSETMLEMAGRKHYAAPVSIVHGNMHSLPFEDESFDAVVATWAVETSSNPGHAVQEFLRVIKPGGSVVFSFAQMPESFLDSEDLTQKHNGRVIENLREALSPEHLPFHACPKSDLQSFAQGLISTVILGKCCEVSSRILPKPFDEFEN